MTTLGNVALTVSFVTALFSAAIYFLYGRGSDISLRLARLFFIVSAIGSIVASLLLWYFFFTHQFQVAYVYQYSSLDLPSVYAISAFWAGQQGTYLLWVLLGSLFGIGVMLTAGRLEPYAMTAFSSIEAFLLFLLLRKGPFLLLPQIPPDGAGLNPLLQDPWMAIHPPLLFAGYAGLAIPFAFAIAGLAHKEYREWINRTLPWLLVAWVAEGAGIVIGSYWAYEVLGWGGYWTWDPTENSSLVPWILACSLIHGILLQRSRDAMPRMNLILALSTFPVILYGTFLTRSGLLTDFSSHALPDVGLNIYLGSAIVAFILTGVYLLFKRWNNIGGEVAFDSFLTRGFAFFITSILFALAAFYIALGMSSPVLTRLVGDPWATDNSYYLTGTIPIAVILILLLGACPFLGWNEETSRKMLARLRVSLVLAAIAGIVVIYLGVSYPIYWLLVTSSVFAVAANGHLLLQALRISFSHIGGYLTHIGVGLIIVGAVASSAYQQSKTVMLIPNTPVEALGYKLTYEAVEAKSNSQEVLMRIRVSGPSGDFLAYSTASYSPELGHYMYSPHIQRTLLEDIFIAPPHDESSMSTSRNQLTLQPTAFEVTRKPLVSFFWTGGILMLAGGAMAAWRRRNRHVEREESDMVEEGYPSEEEDEEDLTFQGSLR